MQPWNQTIIHALKESGISMKEESTNDKSKIQGHDDFFFNIRGSSTSFCCLISQWTRSTIKRFWRPFIDEWEDSGLNHGIMNYSSGQCATMQSSIKIFLQNTMENLLYLQDLIFCDFFLFPKMKSALKRTQFEFIEVLKAKVMLLLNSVSKIKCKLHAGVENSHGMVPMKRVLSLVCLFCSLPLYIYL